MTLQTKFTKMIISTLLLGQAFIISLIVLFLYTIMQPYMIFENLAMWFKNHLPEKLWKPIFDCPICMTPWYGILIYVLLFHSNFKLFNFDEFISFIAVLFSASGFSTLFVYIHQIADSLLDLNSPIEEEKEDVNNSITDT